MHRTNRDQTVLLVVFTLFSIAFLAPRSLPARPRESRRRASAPEAAIRFFHREVGVEGTYVWLYSADLEKREGRGKGRRAQRDGSSRREPRSSERPILDLHELTGRGLSALDAARATAGRPPPRVSSTPAAGASASTSIPRCQKEARLPRRRSSPDRKARDITILDDDRTQSVIRFLARYDRVTGFREVGIGRATRRALDALIAGQHANGGWTQDHPRPGQWTPAVPRTGAHRSLPPSGEATPSEGVLESLHAERRRPGRRDPYPSLRSRGLRRPRSICEAALRGGDFLRLAQLPLPRSPAGPSSTTTTCVPAWARKFEPPAVSRQ